MSARLKDVSPAGLKLVIPDGRPPEVVAFELEVVGFFVDAADLLGFPKSLAAIYGICFASPVPLGFVEIHARLNISTGSLSQGLKGLREVGALTAVRSPGEKRDRFQPALGLRQVAMHFIERRLEPQLELGGLKLLELSRYIRGSGESAKVLQARVETLSTWHEHARAIIPVVKNFLKLT